MWKSDIVIFYCLIGFVFGSLELERSAQLRYCENGQNPSFYADEFRNTYGETYDNFCVTQDLNSMHCCLDDSFDIKNSASIVDFQIYNIQSTILPANETPFGGSPVARSVSRTDFGDVTPDRRCVTFDVNPTAPDCKVIIVYREDDAIASAPNKTAVYFSSMSRIPYSVQYRAPSVAMLKSEKYAMANVTPHSVSDSFFSKWLLCTCFKPSHPSEIPQCELNEYDQHETEFIWKTPVFEVPETTNELCFSIAKQYLGTFGPNRTCVAWKFHSEKEELTMTTNMPLWQKSYFSWILVTLAVLFSIVFVIAVSICTYRSCWAGKESRSSSLVNQNSSPIGVGGTDDISEDEANYGNEYEYINYDYRIQSEKSEYQHLSSDSAFESGKLDSSDQETLPSPILCIEPENTRNGAQPSYQSHPNQITPNDANDFSLYSGSSPRKSENLDSVVNDKKSTESSEETHSNSNQQNGNEHSNTQNWYELQHPSIV